MGRTENVRERALSEGVCENDLREAQKQQTYWEMHARRTLWDDWNMEM